MFKNPILDSFSRTPQFVVPILWIPILIGTWFYGLSQGAELDQALSLFFVGLIFWTFAEYWLHRTVFHYIGTSAIAKRLHFIIHGVHHTWHFDPYRLVMPPFASIALYLPFWFAFRAIFGMVYMHSFCAGFLLGYLIYDMSHFLLHHSKIKYPWFIKLRSNHMYHHFNKDNCKYGVSSSFWDHIFGTVISK